jgi:MFS family permease
MTTTITDAASDHSNDSSSDHPNNQQNTPDQYKPLLRLIAMGFFKQALDSTIVNTALPAMARIVQGVGGAMLLPIGRLAVLSALPRQLFLSAMSFITIPGLIGPLIGPTLGGWLVKAASWHWIFLINVPISIIGAIATLRFMPDLRGNDLATFDTTG